MPSTISVSPETIATGLNNLGQVAFAYSLANGTDGVAIWTPSAGVPGDYNNNGVVDSSDYVLWRKGGPLANEVDTPGTVNAADYTAWRARFGNPSSGSGAGATANTAVPEPSTLVLLILGRPEHACGHVVSYMVCQNSVARDITQLLTDLETAGQLLQRRSDVCEKRVELMISKKVSFAAIAVSFAISSIVSASTIVDFKPLPVSALTPEFVFSRALARPVMPTAYCLYLPKHPVGSMRKRRS